MQHPATAYAYLVTAFTLPVVWVPGLRCGRRSWQRLPLPQLSPLRSYANACFSLEPRAVRLSLLARQLGGVWRLSPQEASHPHASGSMGIFVSRSAPAQLQAPPHCRSEYGQEVVDAIRRLVSILIGIGIPCLVQLTVFPVFACRQLTERLAAALREVGARRGGRRVGWAN